MSKFGGALKKLQTVQQDGHTGNQENLKTREPENVNEKEQAELIPVEVLQERKPENPNSGAAPAIEREKYSTYLDSDLVTALKLYAVRNKMKHHHVVEAALRAYLKDPA